MPGFIDPHAYKLIVADHGAGNVECWRSTPAELVAEWVNCAPDEVTAALQAMSLVSDTDTWESLAVDGQKTALVRTEGGEAVLWAYTRSIDDPDREDTCGCATCTPRR